MSDAADPGACEHVQLEVGRVTKAHGLQGEVVVDFLTDLIDERTAKGTELFANGETLRVASARPHDSTRGRSKWLVRFEGINHRDQAERLRGATLEALSIDDPDVVFVHDLIGKRLIDQHGSDHGLIAAMVDNPASDLIELVNGRLIPMAFYVEHDAETVSVSVPAGLLDDSADE